MELKREYKTRQSQAILDYLTQQANEHVTAAQITAHLSSKGKTASLATVYRHLDRLVEQGEVRRYKMDGVDAACFQFVDDSGCNAHYHLKCECCGALIHLHCSLIDRLEDHVKEEHGFNLNSGKMVFYGLCAECGEN